ncbi:EAL domain-containing protein [Rhizobium sp. CG5]|uniref:putative bifunctional diguanylate cyclase/phosphodiesterase n=1 Tax=Rhizobium sp. CG5 TaxID=2726076 RepID=UPI002033896C|nr:EAL domain-containing protein [Rhizobium sp. CG5]MCM2475897.1 EAL domain-containing protein [Rhizobium sp. CG5]
MKARAANTVPTDVYLSFVSSLFGNRQTLFTGMVVHIVTYLAVYAKSSEIFYLYLTGVFAVICVFRIFWFIRFDQVDKASLTREQIAGWENIYLYGGVSTTSILGIGSGYAIYVLQDPFSELVCIAVTMASMVSVVGRNFGSRKAVNLQTITASLPIMVGCLMLGDFYMVVLSAMLVPFVLTTRKMANGVREFLYKNVIATREIGLIADSFDTALNNMTHGLLMLDPQNRIQVINRKACELLHLGERTRLKNCDIDVVLRYGVRHTFVDGSMPALIQKQLTQMIDGSISRAVMQFSDDLILEFSANRRPEGGVVLIFEDVTARARAERKILQMVRFDALTGLPHRNYFAELVKDRIDQRVGKGPVGFLVLDVNDFKHVNDMKGHLTGDRLLLAIANRLAAAAGSDVLTGHLVGDQFVLFLANAPDADELEARMRAIHAQAAGDYEVDGSTFRVTFSAGGVIMLDEDLRMDEWQIKVDLALFESKSRGKGAFTLFAEEMDARYIERQRLKTDLRAAVESQSLTAVYQPMFTPDGSRVECCEALSRWTHPEKGAIPPNVFIQIAEEMGIVSDITRFMIRQACRDCMTWPEHIAVSVNLSVHDLRDGAIADTIMEALAETGLPASRLHLEVTESSLMEELAAVRTLLEMLRAKGITIAIDDFGTGFSSLSYLDTLPIDVVKIDRSFVRNIGEDARRLKLLRGIVNLSRQLDLEIVVEGVETEDQLALINKYNCGDLIQGYLFSMPVAPGKIQGLSEQAEKRPQQHRGPRVA